MRNICLQHAVRPYQPSNPGAPKGAVQVSRGARGADTYGGKRLIRRRTHPFSPHPAQRGQTLSYRPDTARSVVPVDPEGEGPSIFMVHGADGGIDYARSVARYLPGRFRVWGVRMDGYDGAPPPTRTIPELASKYVEELLDTGPEGGMVIVGYSIGGTLAFEMVRQLESAGHEVALLALIDSRFPPRPEDKGATPAVAALPRSPHPPLKRLWRRWFSLPIKRSVTNICVRTGRRLPRFWGIRTRYFWRMLAASRDAYRPEPVAATMLVLAAEGTSKTHEKTWMSLASGQGEVVEIPTDHLDMIREPYVQELSHVLHQTVVSTLEHGTRDGARV